MDYSTYTVMVVEDNVTTRLIITKLLNKLGFQKFSEASNGKEAYDLLKKDNFDLILSDWNMPVMNGIELLKKSSCQRKHAD